MRFSSRLTSFISYRKNPIYRESWLRSISSAELCSNRVIAISLYERSARKSTISKIQLHMRDLLWNFALSGSAKAAVPSRTPFVDPSTILSRKYPFLLFKVRIRARNPFVKVWEMRRVVDWKDTRVTATIWKYTKETSWYSLFLYFLILDLCIQGTNSTRDTWNFSLNYKRYPALATFFVIAARCLGKYHGLIK